MIEFKTFAGSISGFARQIDQQCKAIRADALTYIREHLRPEQVMNVTEVFIHQRFHVTVWYREQMRDEGSHST